MSLRPCGRATLAAVMAVALAGAGPTAGATAAPQRVVAVGDLHGDFAAWRAIAQDARLEDAQGRWTGGAAVLVQMGDLVDRGPDGRRLVLEFMRLQREARRAGGRVVVLVGNHEAMNMTSDLRYVSAADFAAYADAGSAALRDRVYAADRERIEAAYRARDPARSPEAARKAWYAATPLGWLEHKAAWSPDGAIGRWVIREPATAVLGDTLFVHAGISPGYLRRSLPDINTAVARALAAGDRADTSIINDPQGPLWYRGWAEGLGDAAGDLARTADPETLGPIPGEPQLAQVLAAHGVRRMVIAHTPDLTGIVVSYGGRLIRIDTGISRAYGGALGWLELADSAATPHQAVRPSPGAR